MMKILSCVAVCLLAFASRASADTVFAQVDIDGDSGPTQAGWESWVINDLDVSIDKTESFTTASGIDITVNGYSSPSAQTMNALARGGPDNTQPLYNMYKDAVYQARDSAAGFGRNLLEIEISNLTPDTLYHIRGYAYDQNNGGTDSYQAWGVVRPDTWLDANVSPGSSYQPAVDGVNNPVPTLARSHSTGPWPGNYFSEPGNGAYHYSAQMNLTSDSNGDITFYTWADPDTYTGTQTVTLLNGVQIFIPEPSSFVLLSLGTLLFPALRRRR
jgi:hypothetical protein